MRVVDRLCGTMLREHGAIRTVRKHPRFGHLVLAVLTPEEKGWCYNSLVRKQAIQAIECEVEVGRTWASFRSDLLAAARHVLGCGRSTETAKTAARHLLQCFLSKGKWEWVDD